MMRGGMKNIRMMSTTLVVGHVEGGALSSSTLHALSAATKITPQVSLFVHGASGATPTPECVDKLITSPVEHGIAEEVASQVSQVVSSGSFTHVVGACDTMGKNILPRASALVPTSSMISDVISVEDGSTFSRPTYAGAAIATVKSLSPITFVSVRITAFPAMDAGSSSPAHEEAPASDAPSACTWVSEDLATSDRPSLQGANIVVSGGRGLKSAENFKLMYDLADKLGAAVGASRAAVDAGYAENSMQVGQTGKIVSPDLYIAAAISGAVQHMAGCADSKCIVAINKDPDAPIFQMADYGLVADVFDAVPELQSKI